MITKIEITITRDKIKSRQFIPDKVRLIQEYEETGDFLNQAAELLNLINRDVNVMTKLTGIDPNK